ncbi:MAG TPA: tRNA preQ1(34) S-adenosylmethionine ribosyltransferase-isomerase QueA [Candidatus Limnocylindrales bacterium]|nr:tRNA preQ1(34) S-adenosylmethionine ribosyltransferase-isomerase QueA [Candidatus Limnocylindrales bacterium]
MLVSDFNFHLPEELIAQQPLAERSASRMLQLDRSSGAFQDLWFRDFPEQLQPGDLLVLNNSRVFPARLFGHRSGVQSQPLSSRNPAAKEFLKGRVEVLLTRQIAPLEWQALVRPGRKIGVGERISFGAEGGPAELSAEITARGEFGERTLRFDPVPDFFAAVEKLGNVPLPPYISRTDTREDRERYQTIYANPAERGSVAAPTAGLHFTPEIMERVKERGVEVAEITLHVGLGTFQPLHVDKVEEHRMHTEHYSISDQAADQINRALNEGRRVIAVGTTTVRTLEFVARANNGRIIVGSGEADAFIYPGFQFRVIRGLLTNFHLPQSTLLMLVSAFAGRENVLRAYEHAVADKYRFFSYGDCMFIV